MSVIISGYFDPIHVGHLEYIKNAKKLGEFLTVIVNNDHQATLKKGKPFMKDVERKQIVEAIRGVDNVIISVDQDRTVCKTLEQVVKGMKYTTTIMFCNGGDQNNNTIPEREVCERLGVKLVDGLGEKIQSSSWLLQEKDKN